MRRATALLFAVILASLLAAHAAPAQTGGGYDLEHHAVAAGGGTLAGGSFEITGTVGQAEAGDVAGGDFAVGGGFWPVPGLFGVAVPAASALALALLCALLATAGMRFARRRGESRG